MSSRAPRGELDGVAPATPPATTLAGQVAAEVRWSFTPPLTWLSGVGANLMLSLLWLAAEPLMDRPHRDWAIVVGSYFATFILADVTTTNVLGADAGRVRLGVLRGLSLRRILLVKNLALVVIVALPTLLATALITVVSEADYRLVLTLPGVAFPILTWLGIGNVVSVALPVDSVPLRRRWAQRRQLWSTTRWLIHIVLPYALLLAVDPVARLPRLVATHLPAAIPRNDGTRGVVLCLVGGALWGLGSAVALVIARRYGVFQRSERSGWSTTLDKSADRAARRLF